MPLQKLENADAFVVRDLATDIPAIGIVRSAPKILQSGAKELARSQTYQCAVLNMQLQGASAGVNAPPDQADDVLAAFAAELAPAVQSGDLMLDPAKGVTSAQIAALVEADNRNSLRSHVIDGVDNAAHLTGLGAVVAADATRSLDGAKIAIENFDQTGIAVARAASARGATIVAVSTARGTAFAPDGFDIDALVDGFTTSGPDMITSLSDEEHAAWKVLGADADVLFAGSKMGLIDHNGAPNIKATVIAPTGPIPYTTKGAIMLDREGTAVIPDFVSTAGGLLAGFSDTDDQEAVEANVTSQITSVIESITAKNDSPILEACYLAESFLKTWRSELPFGRPFAA